MPLAEVPPTKVLSWPKLLGWVGTGLVVLLGLYLVSLRSYLLFHSVVEVFSIAVAVGIFMVAWNSRAFFDQSYFLFLGVAFLVIGILDLFHTLAYRGMGVFQHASGNLSTQLWITARIVHAGAFVAAPYFLTRQVRGWKLLAGGAAAVTLGLALTLASDIFPDCYVEGEGLTPFKVASEYIICCLFLYALGLHLERKDLFDAVVLRWICASLLITVASELAFTLYVSVFGIANSIGHLLKVLAFCMIYKAFIQVALTKPYQLFFLDLKRTEEETRRSREHLQVLNRELETSLRLLSEDETAARRIQFLLLPPRRMICGRWEFQSTVRTSAFLSGDFVDYFPISPDLTGFYIADVSGHGVSSAFITLLLKSTMEHLLEQNQLGNDDIIVHPDRVLALLNEYLVGQHFGKYLTMFYGILGQRERALRFSNAGHFPYAMVADESGARLLQERALPVGLFGNATYATCQVPVGSGFHLALFSDGILDVLPQTHVRDKQAYLLSQVGRRELCLEELEDTLGLTKISAPLDDLTVLLLKEAA